MEHDHATTDEEARSLAAFGLDKGARVAMGYGRESGPVTVEEAWEEDGVSWVRVRADDNTTFVLMPGEATFSPLVCDERLTADAAHGQTRIANEEALAAFGVIKGGRVLMDTLGDGETDLAPVTIIQAWQDDDGTDHIRVHAADGSYHEYTPDEVIFLPCDAAIAGRRRRGKLIAIVLIAILGIAGIYAWNADKKKREQLASHSAISVSEIPQDALNAWMLFIDQRINQLFTPQQGIVIVNHDLPPSLLSLRTSLVLNGSPLTPFHVACDARMKEIVVNFGEGESAAVEVSGIFTRQKPDIGVHQNSVAARRLFDQLCEYTALGVRSALEVAGSKP